MSKFTKKDRYSFDDLVTVMKALRTPVTGCPWDLEQDFASILPYTLEEAYEVADAIDQGDMNALREELGDLLLQSIYHAQMASEENIFTIDDVVHDITAKMIFRHPHVFSAQDGIDSADDVNILWEERKAKEKSSTRTQNIFDDVPQALPSLLRAQKIQKRAAKTGFKWADIQDIITKLDEERTELLEAIDSKDTNAIEEELGDLLYVTALLGRHLDINAEESLRKSINKFINRFNIMSDISKSKYQEKFDNLSLEQMIELWAEAKKST